MKKTVLMMTAILTLGVSGAAMAESQIYNPHAAPNAEQYNGHATTKRKLTKRQQRFVQEPNTYMVYPGREYYGQNFGPMPRHPGDYRDAVERGAWSAGSGGVSGIGNRSFDIR